VQLLIVGLEPPTCIAAVPECPVNVLSVTASEPELLWIPAYPLFPVNVHSIVVRLELRACMAPAMSPLLSVNLQPVKIESEEYIPTAHPPTFSTNAQSVTVGLESLLVIPAPRLRPWFATNVHRVTVGLADILHIPPPCMPKLSLNMQLVTVGLEDSLYIPPAGPGPEPELDHIQAPVIVKPSSTVSGPSPLVHATMGPGPSVLIVVTSGPPLLRRVIALPPRLIVSL